MATKLKELIKVVKELTEVVKQLQKLLWEIITLSGLILLLLNQLS